jgi:hypothetical protein
MPGATEVGNASSLMSFAPSAKAAEPAPLTATPDAKPDTKPAAKKAGTKAAEATASVLAKPKKTKPKPVATDKQAEAPKQ